MIEIENLTRTFGPRARPVEAVAGITLTVPPGVTGVVGPNGAGKTTLLALILGFLRPSAGSVDVAGLRPRQYVRQRGAAYLPERFSLPAAWPVRGALRSLAGMDGLSAEAADERVDRVLDRLALTPYADRAMGTLSRGLNQRVGLAQALLAERDLVVLDEPTEGLDPLWRVRFREVVGDMRTAGRTVILASHELPEVERLADRVILLRDGRVQEVVDMGDPAGPLRYRLDLDADAATLDAVFPAAEREEGHLLVTVADHRELSDRLAALLDGGAVLRAVTPAGAELESRVRRGLDGEET